MSHDNLRHSNQPEMPALVERIRAFARSEALWQAGDHLLVAVSGGPDSVMLLDVLQTACAPADRLRLSVAHIHHNLRPDADEDAAFVEDLAKERGLAFVQQWVDVPARVAATGESVEEAARVLRYAALEEIAHGLRADRIVTGHTADDQAETVLMRVLRGTGLTGLAGIPPQRDKIIRPLLPVWRAEIEEYLRLRGLSSRTDGSNLLQDCTRNRIRLELLPTLERDYAPRLRVRLQHLAELARQDELALEIATDDAAAFLLQRLPDGVAVQPDRQMPRALQWRLLRRAISEVSGSLEDIGYDHIMAIELLPPGSEVHLPGVRVLHEAGRLVFLPSPTEETPFLIPAQPLPVPGDLCLSEAGCRLTAEEHAGVLPVESGDSAVIDAGAVRGPLMVRSWQPGDRYRPFGTGGTRKVQDIFVDAGVPKRLRNRIPLVLDEKGILWIAGFRIADRVKLVPETRQTIRLHIEWELNPWTLKRSDLA